MNGAKKPRHYRGKKPGPRVILDPDILGLLTAAAIATGVMAYCLFVQEVAILKVALRAVIAFTVTYAAAFIFFGVLRHIVEREHEIREAFARQEAERLRAEQEAEAAQNEEEE